MLFYFHLFYFHHYGNCIFFVFGFSLKGFLFSSDFCCLFSYLNGCSFACSVICIVTCKIDGQTGAGGSNPKISTGSNTGVSKGTGSSNGTSKSAHYANSNKSGVYGTNASGNFQDSSDNGQNAQKNGDVNSGDSSQGEVSEEGKSYEVVPPSKISKEITDTSGLVVLSIVSIMGMLIYGYWRKEDYD